MKSDIRVEGMHCDGCVRRVTAAVKKVPGVKILSVKVGLVEIENASDADRLATIEAIRAIGFAVSAETP